MSFILQKTIDGMSKNVLDYSLNETNKMNVWKLVKNKLYIDTSYILISQKELCLFVIHASIISQT